MSGMEKRWPVLIVGAKEIARELGLGFRQVKKMLASGELPARQYSRAWVTTRRMLEEWAEKNVGDASGQHAPASRAGS